MTRNIAIFGRVSLFYYPANTILIHILVTAAALITGYPAMVTLNSAVHAIPQLKGYGFNLLIVYVIRIGLIVFLFLFCKWFDQFKRKHLSEQ